MDAMEEFMEREDVEKVQSIVLMVGVVLLPQLLGLKLMYTSCWLIYTLLAVLVVDSPAATGLATTMSITIMVGWYSLQFYDPSAWPALLQGWLGIWAKSTVVTIGARLVDLSLHVVAPLGLIVFYLENVELWNGPVALLFIPRDMLASLFTHVVVVALVRTARLWSYLIGGGLFPSADHVYGFAPPRSKHFWAAAYRMEIVLDLFVPLLCVLSQTNSKTIYTATLLVGSIVFSIQMLRSYIYPKLQHRAKVIMVNLLAQGGIHVGQSILVQDDAMWLDWMTNGMFAIGESYVTRQWTIVGSVNLDDILSRLLTLPQHARRDMFQSWDARLVALTARVFNYPSSSRGLAVQGAGSQHKLSLHFDHEYIGPFQHQHFALWEDSVQTLEEAQTRKLRQVAESLSIQPGMHILDWGVHSFGSMALYLAEHYDILVTSVLQNEREVNFAKSVAAKRGIPLERLDFICASYSQIKTELAHTRKTFDRCVLVGLVETMEQNKFGDFFRVLASRCVKNARVVVEFVGSTSSIVNSSHFWVHSYINPNVAKVLPTCQTVCDSLVHHFVVLNLQTHGVDSDKTFMAWHSVFRRKIEDKAINLPDSFQRTWEFYLLESAACFRVQGYQSYQLHLLTKSNLSSCALHDS